MTAALSHRGHILVAMFGLDQPDAPGEVDIDDEGPDCN